MAEQALADALGLQGSDRARAGAMVVGRFRDGTPLAVTDRDGFIPAKANNFRYDGLDTTLKPRPGAPEDLFAAKCPFQAHIRRVNPRQCVDVPGADGNGAQETERLMHRIVRRGITYGERARTPNAFAALDDLPTGGVGLLFACFQRSILNQFAFLQRVWVNSNIFPLPGGSVVPGQDPVLGRKTDGDFQQWWRKEYGDDTGHQPASVSGMYLGASHKKRFGVGGFVTFKGGRTSSLRACRSYGTRRQHPRKAGRG